jgi:5,6-dimethylbenzimidazole synthase
MADHRFSDPEIAAVYRAIAERRDMRHFRPDPVDPALLQRLLWAAHHAPSVGFMQPWRFIRVTDRALREQMHALVETERQATARRWASARTTSCGSRWKACSTPARWSWWRWPTAREAHLRPPHAARDGPRLGGLRDPEHVAGGPRRRHRPGLGVDLRPVELARLLGMPAGARPVAILCIGHVEAFYPRPMLEMEQWAERMPIDSVMAENSWPTGA